MTLGTVINVVIEFIRNIANTLLDSRMAKGLGTQQDNTNSMIFDRNRVVDEIQKQNLKHHTTPIANKHKHIEAFCLMVYKHWVCGHEEIIYNSRDGFAPFSVPCPICSVKLPDCDYADIDDIIRNNPFMVHRLNLMNYQPDFKVPVGMRMFIGSNDNIEIVTKEKE